MQKSVLVLLVRVLNNENEICLGRRKSKEYATGKWNGFGGKVENGETEKEAAIREVVEEAKVELSGSDLQKTAEILYTEPQGDWKVVVYIVKPYIGVDPEETDEMAPKWFKQNKLPYEEMWENDRFWLDRVLRGELLKGEVANDADGNLISQQFVKLNNFKPNP